MRKKLVPSGHSLALVIDKCVLRLLEIDQGEPFVNVSVEGQRLVIQRSHAHPEPSKPAITGIATVLKTLDRRGMGSLEFARLSRGARLGLFLAQAEGGREVDGVISARLRRCLDRRQSHEETWDETLDVVLAELPDPPASNAM